MIEASLAIEATKLGIGSLGFLGSLENLGFLGSLGNLFLLGNSFLTIGIILNQNESGKENFTQMKNFASNPLEKITWICFFFQLFFLLIDLKLTKTN